MKPDKFAFPKLVLEVKKIEDLRGHKVVSIIFHKFDLLPLVQCE